MKASAMAQTQQPLAEVFGYQITDQSEAAVRCRSARLVDDNVEKRSGASVQQREPALTRSLAYA